MEYCYNTSHHSTMHTTPFMVVYGQPPQPGVARMKTVDKLLSSHDDMLAEDHQRLLQDQQLSKKVL